ncbi:hypothetical protein [Clostridium sp.]
MPFLSWTITPYPLPAPPLTFRMLAVTIPVVFEGAAALTIFRATLAGTIGAKNIASTESRRILVTSTNAAISQQLIQVSTQLTDRIALLEKVKYENQGRLGISVPLLMMIAGLASGLVVFIIQQLMRYF